LICLALFLVVCQALTLSRGGWAGTAGALVFMAVVVLLKKGFAHKRLVGYLMAGIVVTAAIVMASTPVVQRIMTLTQGNLEDNIAHRLNLWEGTRHMIADNPAAGTGPGTFEVAYPPYQQPGYTVLSRYAHNDYLQFTADTGILFIPLMLWLLYLFFRTGFKKFHSRSRQTSGIALGCMAAAIAILIHSYSDGNLQIPANALLFKALAAAGLRKETSGSPIKGPVKEKNTSPVKKVSFFLDCSYSGYCQSNSYGLYSWFAPVISACWFTAY
jgi:O-antigen ligase